MKMNELTPGAILVWGGATVPSGSDDSQSPLMVESIGETTSRVLGPGGDHLEILNQKLEALYEAAKDEVADKLKTRYWKKGS